ncbi:MAG: XRE family transcriptional regulator, partial [Alcaligenaceae bacterium]
MSQTSDTQDVPRTQRTEQVSLELGARLKKLRIEANRSQDELAFDCELDRTYISLIERGRANPSLWTLATIAHSLG